jgi:predicted phage baseplate assembly protein
VKHHETPILDPRDAMRAFDELLARRPAYVPEWIPAKEGTAQALLQIFARYMQAVIDRLNQAPDKNLLAFLDMLGVSLIPARAARAPVVFEPLPNATDARIAAGTRLGAQVPDRPDPVRFETASSIAMAAARLVEVVTLWPARDAYANHSSAVAGGRPCTLFSPLQPVPHQLYLAHDTLFALAGEATVEIEFELATPGNAPLQIAWEHWDGQVWRPFKPFDPADTMASQDGTDGLTRSGVVTLRAACGAAVKTTVHGINAYWVRGRLAQLLPPEAGRVLPMVDRIRVRTVMDRSLSKTAGVLPDAAFADGLALDLGNTIYPFGQQPQPGSTFYLTSAEIFSKPRAQVTLSVSDAQSLQEQADDSELDIEPTLSWEYWDGQHWRELQNMEDNTDKFQNTGILKFVIPEFLTRREINSRDGLWLRVRLAAGGYGRKRIIEWQAGERVVPGDPIEGIPPTTEPIVNRISYVEVIPPALSDLRLGYIYRSPWERPEHCLTYNDFQFALHSRDVRVPGRFFPPFRPVADTTPACYLGFDRPLPNDLISLFLDIQEDETATPPLVWEAWDGTSWRTLSVTDETAGLRRPGMVSFIAPDVAPRPQATVTQANDAHITVNSTLEAAKFQPGDQVVIRQDKTSDMVIVTQVEDDALVLETPLTNVYTSGTVSLAALPRFGTSRDWVRARLKADGAPAASLIHGMHVNATWAMQVQTINDEVLGSGTGQPRQSLFFTQIPVLPGEWIEVRELEGARAAVEWPMLQEELRAGRLTEDNVRLVFDPRTGNVSEVWVRWQSRPHLFFSGPDDRHYVVEPARGRVIFGDGQHGRLPTVGANNIRARRYQAGGGLAGNVPAGTITQLLSTAPFVQSVHNPRAADGGAEGETLAAVKTRGPQTLRHRGRALAARDYEALAREASPGVAAARALPATAPNGRPAPGWVTVIIVPQSQDPRPQPSFELRRQVHAYLTARMPATLTPERVAIIGPTYLPIGVEAVVTPRDASEAGGVEARVRAALAGFLHPLAGGPEADGWPLGRDVYLSDVAAIIEAVDGVDYVEALHLLLYDIPQGEQVIVPPDRIVVAGTLRLEMRAAER